MNVSRLISRIRHASFVRDERGSATLEMLLWLPLFFFLLLLTVDASIVYWRHGEMWNAARDLARAVASNLQQTNQTAIDSFIAARYANTPFADSSNWNVQVSVASGDVTVIVQKANGTLSGIGIIEGIMTVPVAAAVRMRMEPL